MGEAHACPFSARFLQAWVSGGPEAPSANCEAAQPSRAPGRKYLAVLPWLQYKPPHPGARAGPGTTQSPPTPSHPRAALHGLAYYCVPWPVIPGSLPFCFSKATTRQPLHHLTLHQESHLLSQKIIAAALPFCQTPLLPDKPLLRPKADHQKLPFASDISECDSGFPSRRAVCGRPICPATPKTARRKTTEKP